MSKRLMQLRARRNRNDPAQQEEFERLNAREVFGVTLPDTYDAASYVVALERRSDGSMVAQLANGRAAEAFVKDGQLWLQGFFATTRATPEGRPRKATGMSEKAAGFLRRNQSEAGKAGLGLAIGAALIVGFVALFILIGASVTGRWFNLLDGAIFLLVVALGVAGACMLVFGKDPGVGLLLLGVAVGLFLLWSEVV